MWRDDGRAALRALLAGGWLALCELVWLGVRGHDLFLSHIERVRAALAVAATGLVASVLAWTFGSAVVRLAGVAGAEPEPEARRRAARRLGTLAGLAVAPLAAGLLWAATEGRRLRSVPGRGVAVILAAGLAAVVAGLLVAWLSRWVRRPGVRGSRTAAAACALVAILLVWANGAILPRLYPAIHAALGLAALAAVLTGALVARVELHRALGVLPLMLVLGSFPAWSGALGALRTSSNASFVVEQHAPLTGRVVAAWRRTRGDAWPSRRDGPPPRAPARVGLDLRRADVLVITVDALRADRLSVYGHRGTLTPHMDALAREGMTFRRAYTPTPHTSYAIAGLWTGKFLRSVLQLEGSDGDEHPTVAGLLRRHGYHTAAFYPPALFAVDGPRFASLEARGFDFEHRDESYAPAPERVRQLRRHLAGLKTDAPVFAWVHLFEPHEPYDARPLDGADGPEARYDAEVSLADSAVGELVRIFREARPGATVVLTSDHGEEHGDHGGYYHGTTLYDEQVRVPLLWSTPGEVEPGSVDVPVEILDIGPTLLTALGVPPDPRMRGDDLGPVLAGDPGGGPRHAFASVGDRRMVTDGRFKAICAEGDPGCRLYDLQQDPGERRNLGPDHPERVKALREVLGAFVASIPEVERGQGTGSLALDRADLGDPTVGPALLPLLGHAEAAIRRRAAHGLGRVAHAPARPVLATLAREDEDAGVRAEAAVSALVLGEEELAGEVRALAGAPDAEPSLRRLAALALAEHGHPGVVEPLVGLVRDAEAAVPLRRRAILALGRLRAVPAVADLIALLEDPVLRVEAAEALGAIGDRRAGHPLAEALETEAYLPARRAEARALAALGHPRTTELVRRWLGTPSSLPGGVALLLEVGALRRPSGAGVDLRRAGRFRRGTWRCEAEGCVPGSDATLVLPADAAPQGPVRVVLRVHAPLDRARVTFVDESRVVPPGTWELSFDAPPVDGPRAIRLASEGEARIVAAVVVPRLSPPTEPLDAGAVHPDGGAVTPR